METQLLDVVLLFYNMKSTLFLDQNIIYFTFSYYMPGICYIKLNLVNVLKFDKKFIPLPHWMLRKIQQCPPRCPRRPTEAVTAGRAIGILWVASTGQLSALTARTAPEAEARGQQSRTRENLYQSEVKFWEISKCIFVNSPNFINISTSPLQQSRW